MVQRTSKLNRVEHMRKNLQRVIGVIVVVLGCLWPIMAQAQDVSGELDRLAEQAQAAATAASSGQAAAYEAIHEAWEAIEDGIRDQDPTLYVELETALDAVKDAVAAGNPADTAQAFSHLGFELHEGAERFAEGAAAGLNAVAATPADLQDELTQVLAALQSGDAAEADAHIERAIRMWPGVEGAIAAKSPQDYETIERALGAAMTARAATPIDTALLQEAATTIRTTLAPYLATQTYTAVDAAAIIIREGLEALLVIVALLAFLRKSGNARQSRWIWVGAGGGVALSIVTAFIFQAIFSQISAGRNREIVEGVTGLVAAGLLFYVSYWLHSKASLSAWQKYIRTQTSQALARGSLFGVAALSFLAVFREGAETAIFYLGMAPSIQPEALLLGLGVGVAVLAVVAVVMVVGGVRLPLRPFFLVAGLLVYYLGFKFLGTGVHALQVAGVLPSSPVPFLPEASWLGVYATWESFAPQLLLLVATGALWWAARTWTREPATGKAPASS